jgi:hypothetical protein
LENLNVKEIEDPVTPVREGRAGRWFSGLRRSVSKRRTGLPQ